MRMPAVVLTLNLMASISFAFEEKVDFSRQIRPILSDHCYSCHGVDPGSRKADLRLDQREDAVASRDGIPAIVPGKPNESLIWQRIVSTDPELVMPPHEGGRPLNDQQKQLLKRWIEEGAEYQQHWAFSPLTKPAIPEVKTSDEAGSSGVSAGRENHPIDAFIQEKLKTAGLKLSPQAEPAVLVRRLYQDLLGLQPIPEEADLFAANPTAEAWEQLVNRVLDNPHYGERWGRHWLDQARYADSNGYTIDGPRIMWPYRDWVIDAVNRDMPFDQFTIEQLAGDLLPGATKSQQIATGFHRNTLINQEGGVKPDQYRNEALVDRVNTTGAVWLGLTLGCAQCHTHKYDPVSHREYYQVYAFFNRCDDANNEATTVEVLENELFGWTEQQQNDLTLRKELAARLVQLERSLIEAKSAGLLKHEWNWKPAELLDYRTLLGMGDFLRQKDDSLLSDRRATPNDPYQIIVRTPGQQITAIRLRVLPHESLPSGGPGLAENGNFVLTSFEARVGDKVSTFTMAAADHSQEGYSVLDAIDGKPDTGWAINNKGEQLKRNPDVRMNAPHEAVFVLGAPLGKVEAILTLRHDLNQNYLIGRFAIDLSEAAPPTSDAASIETEIASVKQQLEQIEKNLPGGGRSVRQMVMRDTDVPAETFVLKRGDFLTPDKEQGPLPPSVPTILRQGQQPELKTRLDLAKWLVSRDNPLTARVTVNRIWMRYFGQGLVETENDFGIQGSLPTHPELLDWLASELIDQGWSMKKFHRMIVTSKTWQQSSEETPELVKADPRNLLLGRQSRLRVDAEIVRDLVLSVAGSLTPKIGGPSVHPPQPEGVYSFTQNVKTWPETKGPDRYRRTMYTMFYRSAPYPLMTTFDSPEFSTVCTRRMRSNTPLQALAVANDPMFFEQAQLLAARLLTENHSGDLRTVMTRLFRLCLIRQPSEKELTVLEKYWIGERDRYQQNAELATKVAPAGTFEGVPTAELAAWTSTSRVLINTDEFLTRN
ncbi:MAG: PSD1 and planctomycete cytochrome C domain-containing protein [Planctomyces sp.]